MVRRVYRWPALSLARSSPLSLSLCPRAVSLMEPQNRDVGRKLFLFTVAMFTLPILAFYAARKHLFAPGAWLSWWVPASPMHACVHTFAWPGALPGACMGRQRPRRSRRN